MLCQKARYLYATVVSSKHYEVLALLHEFLYLTTATDRILLLILACQSLLPAFQQLLVFFHLSLIGTIQSKRLEPVCDHPPVQPHAQLEQSHEQFRAVPLGMQDY